MILRFAILLLGLRAGVDFLAIVALQTVVLVGGMLVPALWVMVRELHYEPHLAVPRRADYSRAFPHRILHLSHAIERRPGRQGRHHDPRLCPARRRSRDRRSPCIRT